MESIAGTHETGSSPDPSQARTDRPQPARMYDFYLGGKTSYPADIVAAKEAMRVWPGIEQAACQNRGITLRSTRWLAAQAVEMSGIPQVLDIGCGLPNSPTLHEVVGAVEPASRVVYVDNDPLVLRYRDVLRQTVSPAGRAEVILADITRPETITSSHVMDEVLDLRSPLIVTVGALFHFIPDDHGAQRILDHVAQWMPSGSRLLMTHVARDGAAPHQVEAAVEHYNRSGVPAQARTRVEVGELVTRAGLAWEEPGLLLAPAWRPDMDGTWIPQRFRAASDAPSDLWAGVAVKP